MKRRMLLGVIAAAVLAVPRIGYADPIKLRELYNKDLSFSDFAVDKEGSEVEVAGFMAPPLKAEAKFFVLTKKPMAVCPFCESEAEWPDDILVVYVDEVLSVVPFNYPIAVSGELALGTYRDEESGFVSRVRLVDASYRRL